MADDFFKVVKSVSKLVREKTEDLFGNVTPLERALREVTDEDSCTISNSLLRHIAVTTHDAFAYNAVVEVLWKGLASQSWQCIYKCLSLFEFMILLGPDRCRQDAVAGQPLLLRSLTNFRFHDGRREQGGGVRQKAATIIKLLQDEDYFKAMKDQAIKDQEKYAGGIENQPYMSPISHLNLHTRATNPFFTGPDAMPPFALRGGSERPFGSSPFGGGNSGFGGGNPFTTGYSSREGGGGGGGNPSRPRRTGGGQFGEFYDPGDDFNTSNPFYANPFDEQQQQRVPGSNISSGGARSTKGASLLDDDDDDTDLIDYHGSSKPTAVSPALEPAPAPAAPPSARGSRLIPDLLD